MICPACGKDYKDVPEGEIPGHFYRSDPHFGLKKRRFGMQCTNCGFVAEWFSYPTGEPYHKRSRSHRDEDTYEMFPEYMEQQN